MKSVKQHRMESDQHREVLLSKPDGCRIGGQHGGSDLARMARRMLAHEANNTSEAKNPARSAAFAVALATWLMAPMAVAPSGIGPADGSHQ